MQDLEIIVRQEASHTFLRTTETMFFPKFDDHTRAAADLKATIIRITFILAGIGNLSLAHSRWERVLPTR
jgi:hypothetical protein